MQIGFQADETGRLGGHRGRVDGDLAGLLAFRDRQRDIRLPHYVLRALLAQFDAGEADCSGHDHLLAAQFEWRAQLLLQSASERRQSLRGDSVQGQQRELIAAPARQHGFKAECGLLETLRCLHHQLVAGGVAQHVIDEFESRDVDQDDGNAFAALRADVLQCPVQCVHEVAPVGKAGKRIVEARVVERLLQTQAPLHLGRELLVRGT